MADELFALADDIHLTSPDLLKLPRSRGIVEALHAHPDFKVLGAFRSPEREGAEFISATVECHGVPGRNRHGIKCPENILFLVPADSSALVEVCMLRKDFPILMHQSRLAAGLPAALCLYTDSPLAVLRTWTPQRLLQRILWWLEKTAKDELHLADQPVEMLFFSSKYELVLPWNYDELKKQPEKRLVAIALPERPDGGLTCLVEVATEGSDLPFPSVTLISLDLPPIVHGAVETDPSTLGELADMLKRRDLDVFTPLKEHLRSQVGLQGAISSQDTQLTVILLNIPVQRNVGDEPTGLQRRAFGLDVGGYKLGEAIGALFQLDGKYFNAVGVLGDNPGSVWRSRDILPMSVLQFNNSDRSRLYSGISEEGPRALLIGAGALGGDMLNLWGRSGWGQWTVVDKDHVKPHNLARHQAFARHVGMPKAHAMSALHRAMNKGSSIVSGLCADAIALDGAGIKDVLNQATFVVDASTTLEYPRAVSMRDDVPRHISTFITPNGNSAVLLAEDAERKQRLRTLEAQYYRAIIEHQWGETHLGGSKTFWSGASCRDISVVMPYSKIQVHASTLAEQIMQAWKDSAARICVWQRDPQTGAIAYHHVATCTELNFEFGPYRLYIDEGAIKSLREKRQQALPDETGGVLLGYFDFNINAVIVVAALPAPSDSKGSRSSFERGTEGLGAQILDVQQRTAGVVGYLGEWHSHPPGHSARPSGDDLLQLKYLSENMAKEGLPGVQLIVGENEISLMHASKKEVME